ncbi:VPA1262 family N-terminal domain-containing protein [Cohaesibacter gelatinilyticus]|uniref:Uncharacterized protein n=1 Tax=Cohaesibacter gelatinilyticus TaxID=372072 RepID=A0A285NDE0_9HYPH|nr:VPA1262 family N-terminal domain-containing protein [Cohaesibacter gelatinilyticus]SNZ07449.1 hypothetical protein SAMN06265368_0972 [Cohaesibacter gelatinilyticus]
MTMNNAKHWLWIATTSKDQIVYGCLVFNAEFWSKLAVDISRKSKLMDGNLTVFQALLDSAEALDTKQVLVDSSVLDLTQYGGPCVDLSKGGYRLDDGFGKNSVPVETYLSVNFPELSDERWLETFELLEQELGIKFRYAPAKLGTLEIFQDLRADLPKPLLGFKAGHVEDHDFKNYPDKFNLIKLGKFNEQLNVHVQLKLGDDLVYSKLLKLSSSRQEEFTALPFDRYSMSVFDDQGSLVQLDEHPLITRIPFNMSPMQGTLQIDDTLTRSAQGVSREVGEQASIVKPRSTQRSMVGVNVTEYETHRLRNSTLVDRLFPSSEYDRWFPKGVTEEVGVIRHLNKLLDGGQVKSAIIVDPFFGIDTLKRVITRLESVDVKLTIVTSLCSTDPETNRKTNRLVEDLDQALMELRDRGVPRCCRNLNVVNMTDGNKQAFHDRYLCLSTHDGQREIYLMSNSLNKMAGNWPFCLTKIDAPTTQQVLPYIDGLARGEDVSGATNSEVDYRWP